MSGTAGIGPEATAALAARVEAFVREVVAPYEKDPRRDHHECPGEDLIAELKDKAREAGLMTPHILPDGRHPTQRETAIVLQATGLSPLGPLALNTAAPDEGNMYLLGKVGSAAIKDRFLRPLVEGKARSAFFMTEPAAEGGAGSDPSMMQTRCHLDGNHWVVNGRKAFITGADGAQIGIVMAKSMDGACMFLVDLPDPAIRIERAPNTIDSSMPGGHAVVTINNLRVPADQMLGQSGEGFRYAQVRLAPARLDVISIDGFECAGHPGEDDIPGLILIPATADQVKIPIIASGGFGDGRGLAAALALGAEGVNMGTRFCATQEAPIHDRVKQFLVANDERATNLIFRRFHNTGRVAKNSISDRVVDISKKPEAVFEDIRPLVGGALGRKALETGDLDAGLVWAGQVQGLIHDIPSCRELLDRIIIEAETIISSRLAGFTHQRLPA